MKYHCSASGQHTVKNSACCRMKAVSKECLALPPAYAAAGELYKLFHYLTPSPFASDSVVETPSREHSHFRLNPVGRQHPESHHGETLISS